jgi:soluble lytic murein transglycosylase-like protein
MNKHLIGFGMLMLTLIPAVAVSRARIADAVQRSAEGAAESVSESTPAPTISSHVKEAARRYAVSEELVVAVIEVESQFNPRAVSPRGAQGLMQLMPATAATLGVRDVFNPKENIHGGVKHLAWLMERFDGDVPTVIAAYNAGEGAIARNRGVPPSRETREYVKRVLALMHRGTAQTL